MPTKKKSTPQREKSPVKIIVEVVIKNETTREQNRSNALANVNIDPGSYSALIESHELGKLPPLETMVKQAILKAAGRVGNPEDLSNDIELSDLFSSNAAYILLRAYLEGIAQLYKPAATISLNEVMGCTTVGDCIDLVKAKTN